MGEEYFVIDFCNTAASQEVKLMGKERLPD
jgi:hypothetical protein